MGRKLTSIALTVSRLLAGCGGTTPTAPPPSPAGSPAACHPGQWSYFASSACHSAVVYEPR
jgi:hypothetical protein